MTPKTLKYRFTYRPRNDIRIQKAFLRCVKMLSDISPYKKDLITRYFIELGVDYGFTRKHMIKLFEKRIKHVTPPTED